MSRAEAQPTRVISNRTTVIQRVAHSVRKESKVRYENSALSDNRSEVGS